MTKEEAKCLRRQKDSIQMMVFNCVKLNQDAKHLIIEYYKIVDKLVNDGYKVYIRSPYLKLDYWGLTPNDIYNTKIETPVESISNTDKILNSFVLKLAWTGNKTYPINKIEEYFNNMNFNCIEEEGCGEEHIIKCELQTTQEEFQIYKKSAIFLLETITNDPNIAIFGRKIA